MSLLGYLQQSVNNIPFTCHQMPERSFKLANGALFPVCARCTGVLLGQTTALLFLVLTHPHKPSALLLLLSLPLCIDWFIQYTGIKQSTNTRRVITGVLGGFGGGVIYYWLMLSLIVYLLRLV